MRKPYRITGTTLHVNFRLKEALTYVSPYQIIRRSQKKTFLKNENGADVDLKDRNPANLL